MRLPPTVVLLALAAGAMAGACTSNPTSVTGFRIDAPPIPPPVVRSVGALPDGTPFDIQIDSGLSETVEGISGGVVIDLDGSPQAVGIVMFGSPPRDEHYFHHGVVLPPGGGIYIDFYDSILDELGADHEQIIRSSIRGTINRGFPGLDLDPPFRWATDEELTLNMEIRFTDFVVRRGCGELALACSATGSVQVIPLEGSNGTGPNWDEIEVLVDSLP